MDGQSGQAFSGRLTRGIIMILVGVIIWFLPVPAGVKNEAWHLLAIFVTTVLGVILQPPPIEPMVLIGLMTTITTGVLKIGEALSGFGNNSVWLAVVTFLIARGFIITGLGFGAEDYLRELGEEFALAKLTPDKYFPILHYPRSVISVTANALHIQAIDRPFFGLLIDTDALEREATKAKLLGFEGKMVIHPRQVDTVNRVFSPSAEDLEFSRKMVNAYQDAASRGKGSAVLDGRMIDYAMYLVGTDMIAKAEAIAGKASPAGRKILMEGSSHDFAKDAGGHGFPDHQEELLSYLPGRSRRL